MSSDTVPFYIYGGFPRVTELLACPEVRRTMPFAEPMGQFFAEVHAALQLEHHPWRVYDPERASVFYVPLLAKLSSVARSCALPSDGGQPSSHRDRMLAAAGALSNSPWLARRNGSDHLFVCTAIEMRPLLGKVWRLFRGHEVMHAVHYVPRGAGSPAQCQLLVPYLTHSHAASQSALASPFDHLPRDWLAHFRGRASSKVRSVLARRYGRDARFRVLFTEYWTTAGCNVRKCWPDRIVDRRSHLRVNETNFDWVAMADEMARSTFCLIPPSEGPESSRLYLAIMAACIPVLMSDDFVGAFPHVLPWSSFTVRVAEADVLSKSFNLTSHLLSIANDKRRLGSMQWALRAYAPDVLWHTPGSRVATNMLRLAALARTGGFCGSRTTTAAEQTARSHGIWWRG